jgi:hypothetical protein
MNERIRELAEQAGLGVKHNGIVLTKNVNAAEAFENFAQLIVAECLGIVHDAERGGSNEIWDNAALSWNNALKFIRRDLQEHFGVEE